MRRPRGFASELSRKVDDHTLFCMFISHFNQNKEFVLHYNQENISLVVAARNMPVNMKTKQVHKDQRKICSLKCHGKKEQVKEPDNH